MPKALKTGPPLPLECIWWEILQNFGLRFTPSQTVNRKQPILVYGLPPTQPNQTINRKQQVLVYGSPLPK